MPANVTSMVVQRVLVKNGFSRDMATMLIADLKRAMAEALECHPAEKVTDCETEWRVQSRLRLICICADPVLAE